VLSDVINRILHGADFLCVFIGDFYLKGRMTLVLFMALSRVRTNCSSSHP